MLIVRPAALQLPVDEGPFNTLLEMPVWVNVMVNADQVWLNFQYSIRDAGSSRSSALSNLARSGFQYSIRDATGRRRWRYARLGVYLLSILY